MLSIQICQMYLKGWSLLTHPHVVQNQYDFISFVKSFIYLVFKFSLRLY